MEQTKKKVSGGENVTINLTDEKENCFKPQNIPLNVIYEDNDIIVINKPHNLIVHPGAGNPDGTIFNALLHYYPPIISVPRAGIVHRLDKNTTGLLIVAKTTSAQIALVKSLQLREIIREYEAIVIGNVIDNGVINQPIGRHPTKRTKMSVSSMGKPAITHYYVVENFYAYTHLRLRITTGRTHQIRVHMLHITHPLVGDPLYGHAHHQPLTTNTSRSLAAALHKFNRQALHATMLRFYHPISHIKMECYAPIPQDMTNIIDLMRNDFGEHKTSNESL